MDIPGLESDGAGGHQAPPARARHVPHPLFFLGGGVVLFCLAWIAITALHRPGSGGTLPEPGSNAYQPLLHCLAGIEPALGPGRSAAKLVQLADEIQAEIKRHPLPDGDDFRFSGELIVRYLRTLATIENHRELQQARKGHDPLEVGSPQADPEAIAAWNKYSTSLRQRIEQLTLMIQKSS